MHCHDTLSSLGFGVAFSKTAGGQLQGSYEILEIDGKVDWRWNGMSV